MVALILAEISEAVKNIHHSRRF